MDHQEAETTLISYGIFEYEIDGRDIYLFSDPQGEVMSELQSLGYDVMIYPLGNLESLPDSKFFGIKKGDLYDWYSLCKGIHSLHVDRASIEITSNSEQFEDLASSKILTALIEGSVIVKLGGLTRDNIASFNQINTVSRMTLYGLTG